MTSDDIDEVLSSLIERLAAIEHERWSHWQRYLHEKGQRRPDGSLLLPGELVSRWERQMSMPYSELSTDEKSSDREQVQRYLPLIKMAFQAANNTPKSK